MYLISVTGARMSENEESIGTSKKNTPEKEDVVVLAPNIVQVEDEGEVITLNADQGAAAANEFVDDEEQESREQQERQAEQERSMRRPTNAREVLTQFVPNRSERADEKLRSHLIGKIAIKIDGTSDEYLFELIKGRAQVQEGSGNTSDCTIRISEQNLMRVVAGELNPQIAMLSGKIKVDGKAELAIYFFNLVAPRAH